MNNATAILRSLIVYAICVSLAVFVGYLLSDPLNRSTITYTGILVMVFVFPILLRWHHPLLVFSWNMTAVLFFLPGRPYLWLAMTAISMGILLLQRALGSIKHFFGVPQITWSLIFLIGVVLFTAKMTGLGLKSMGSDVSGGKRYAYLLGAICGYFALSGRRIPPGRAGLYVGLYFLGGLTALISDFFPITPEPLHFIYLIFPPNTYYWVSTAGLRLGGAMIASSAVFSYMLAKYGIRGIFLAGKPWRWVMFSLVLIYSLSSGFRGQTILYALILAIMFYLEGLHRTKLLPILVFIGISTAALTIPLITHLPYSFQRSLAFLPLNFDPAVQEDARKSWEWRVDMWKALMPQIPPHLLLGKGYAMSQLDIALLTGPDAAVRPGESFVENQFLSLSGAYHNGPLSIVLTFGIWGCIAMAWFWTVSMRVLYRNYRYGDPALRTVNMLLMVTFGSRILIFSSLDVDMLSYCGLLGLSVSLNGEACRPAPEPVRETDKLQAFDAVRSRLRPAFQHSKTQA